MKALKDVRTLTTLALLAAAGVSLFVLESFIPMPVPFLKIGLANISALLALTLFGAGEMMLVVMIRILVGSMLVGSLFSPAFILALIAGVASALVMALVMKLFGRTFSLVGISLCGSTTHVLAQYAVAQHLYIQNPALVALVPFLLLSALIGGLVVGWMSARLLPLLPRLRAH
jgi:heptaprenyl diphosphate synthase